MGVENFYIEKGSAESSSVIFSNGCYGAFPMVLFYNELTLGKFCMVAESLSVHIQVVKYCTGTLMITCSDSIICIPFWVKFGSCRSSIKGIILISFMAIARGSPCVVPSVDVKTVLLTYKFKGC